MVWMTVTPPTILSRGSVVTNSLHQRRGGQRGADDQQGCRLMPDNNKVLVVTQDPGRGRDLCTILEFLGEEPVAGAAPDLEQAFSVALVCGDHRTPALPRRPESPLSGASGIAGGRPCGRGTGQRVCSTGYRPA